MALATQQLELYIDGAAGNDANSGSTTSATSTASGTGASTDGTATVDLSGDTPDLSGVASGDTIRIVGRVDGFNSKEIFEITAVDDGLDTVTVNPSPGVAAGQTWAIGGAWATLGEGLDFCTNGNGRFIHINVKASATYNEAVLFNGAQGIVSNPCRWSGYTSTAGDDGIVTIDAQSARTHCINTNGTMWIIFENFHGTNATTGALGDGGAGVTWRRCRASNSARGFQGGGSTYFIGCQADGNTNDGITDTATEERAYACIANDNGQDGIALGAGVIWGCLGYSNARNNLSMTNSADYQLIVQSTADGDAKDSDGGIKLSDPNQSEIVNCLVIDCDTGIESGASGDDMNRRANFGNCVNGCTTPYTTWDAGVGAQTSDPSFVNEGTDYGLASGEALAQQGLHAGSSEWGWGTSANGDMHIGALPGVSEVDADFPAAADVEDSVSYDNGNLTGTVTLPTAAQVEEDVLFGAGGTEFTGELATDGGGSGFAHSGALS